MLLGERLVLVGHAGQQGILNALGKHRVQAHRSHPQSPHAEVHDERAGQEPGHNFEKSVCQQRKNQSDAVDGRGQVVQIVVQAPLNQVR